MQRFFRLQANLWRTPITAYARMLLLIILSVHLWDRNIAQIMHELNYASPLLKLLSQTPVLLEVIATFFMLSLIVKQWRERFLILAINLIATLILASVARVTAKFIFGRTWPETWIYSESSNNPSWISNSVEGFHPFASGMAYNSFPSGHALFTFALATVFWFHFPRLKLVWLSCMMAVLIGQLGQNYHFLGDLLAGATLGVLIAHLVIVITKKLPHLKNVQPQKR